MMRKDTDVSITDEDAAEFIGILCRCTKTTGGGMVDTRD